MYPITTSKKHISQRRNTLNSIGLNPQEPNKTGHLFPKTLLSSPFHPLKTQKKWHPPPATHSFHRWWPYKNTRETLLTPWIKRHIIYLLSIKYSILDQVGAIHQWRSTSDTVSKIANIVTSSLKTCSYIVMRTLIYVFGWFLKWYTHYDFIKRRLLYNLDCLVKSVSLLFPYLSSPSS